DRNGIALGRAGSMTTQNSSIAQWLGFGASTTNRHRKSVVKRKTTDLSTFMSVIQKDASGEYVRNSAQEIATATRHIQTMLGATYATAADFHASLDGLAADLEGLNVGVVTLMDRNGIALGRAGSMTTQNSSIAQWLGFGASTTN